MSSSQIHCDYELLSRINCSRDNWEVGICEFFCRNPMFPFWCHNLWKCVNAGSKHNNKSIDVGSLR